MFCIHPSPFIKSLKGFRLSGELRWGERLREQFYIERWLRWWGGRERERVLVVAGVSCCLCFCSTRSELAGGWRIILATALMTRSISRLGSPFYFQHRAWHFLMEGLRWFMLWPWLPSKSTRALWRHFPRRTGEGTSLCREGNPGSKEGIRAKELFLVLLVVT